MMRHISQLKGRTMKGIWLCGILIAICAAAGGEDKMRTTVTGRNPAPDVLPTLSVWEQRNKDRLLVYVKSAFPNVPNFTCDTWCYESDVEFLEGKALEGGEIELRHRWKARPEVIFRTTVTPEAGTVRFLARAEVESGKQEGLPKTLMGLNACWQLRSARDFASQGGAYPEFVARCFIFTKSGFTYLDKTKRNKHTRWPETDKFNNPPWVQIYGPVWRPLMKTMPQSFAATSSDRYTYPIMGAVSRDKKHLAAIANDSGNMMAQAWHDCMHNNANWAADKAGGELLWQIRIYAMENDPQLLLKCVGRDFPKALTLKEGQVDAETGK